MGRAKVGKWRYTSSCARLLLVKPAPTRAEEEVTSNISRWTQFGAKLFASSKVILVKNFSDVEKRTLYTPLYIKGLMLCLSKVINRDINTFKPG